MTATTGNINGINYRVRNGVVEFKAEDLRNLSTHSQAAHSEAPREPATLRALQEAGYGDSNEDGWVGEQELLKNGKWSPATVDAFQRLRGRVTWALAPSDSIFKEFVPGTVK